MLSITGAHKNTAISPPQRMLKDQRYLPYAVVAAHLAAYAVVRVVSVPNQDNLPLIALPLAQHALLYSWAGLGTGRWMPRLGITYGVSVFLWSLPSILKGIPLAWTVPTQAVGTAVLMAIVVVPLAVARTRGFRLQRLAGPKDPAPGGLQITIRSMLIVTAIVACLLALGSNLDASLAMRGSHFIGAPTGFAEALAFAWVPLLFTGSAMLSVWASLSAGTTWSRMVVAIAILTAAGAFGPYAFDGDRSSYGFWITLPLLTFFVTSLTLLVFRLAGYRFMRA
jgi:hypothetical protein